MKGPDKGPQALAQMQSPPPAAQPAARPIARGAGMRRSQRVFLNVPVTVYGWSADGQVFNEESVTAVVNAHGALLTIRNKVRERQDLFVRNEHTGSEVKCTVVHTAPAENGTEVGVSFCEEAPGFWGVYFPPDEGGGTARTPR